MAKIPDYLIEFDLTAVEDNVTKTVEKINVEENEISLEMVVGISLGVVVGLFFFCILSMTVFFIKKKPHREVQKRSIYRGK